MDYGMCLLLIEGEEKVAAFIKRGLVGGRSRSVYNAQTELCYSRALLWISSTH
jgi:hypothetical protein